MERSNLGDLDPWRLQVLDYSGYEELRSWRKKSIEKPVHEQRPWIHQFHGEIDPCKHQSMKNSVHGEIHHGDFRSVETIVHGELKPWFTQSIDKTVHGEFKSMGISVHGRHCPWRNQSWRIQFHEELLVT